MGIVSVNNCLIYHVHQKSERESLNIWVRKMFPSPRHETMQGEMKVQLLSFVAF